ncbi:PspC domain-containing protein [Aeromicrobium phragmitis]|uniref:PspC domain-containing protein n=1 Tax=Aeromicrobium phragmitis TaxID=2478914 RepID=A0A3L8PIQ3_9ACTN|nr:PspC domain-containing protein [Aeromicrobium phragmitis]RLV54609.1 PspC domain-containing protein [Aeromicrobium phragmitis]
MTDKKKLQRSRSDKWLGGVCGGIAAYTGWDVNLVRLLVVLLTVFSTGTAIIAYIAAWILLPEETISY